MSDRADRMARLAVFLIAALELGAVGFAPVAILRIVQTALGVFALAVLLPAEKLRLAKLGLATAGLLAGIFAEVRFESSHLGLLACATALGLASARARGLAAFLVLASALERVLLTRLGYHGEQAFQDAASGIGGLALPNGLELGPVHGGVRLGLLALLLIVCTSRSGARRSLQTAATVLASLPLFACGVGVLLAAAPPFGSDDAGLAGRMLPMLLPHGLLVLAGLGTLLLPGASEPRSPRGAIVALSLAWLVAAACESVVPDGTAPRSFAVYERGLLSWGKPTDDVHGEYSLGMLGTLPDFLRAHRCEAELVPRLDAEQLAGHDALVIVNLDHGLSAGERTGVRAFVERGGSLFVIGDHTFLKQDASAEGEGEVRLFLNDVLEGSSIAFLNDSADQFSPGWENGTRLAGRSSDLVCTPGNPSGVLVGASLGLGLGATPLVVGVHGYSDLGLEQKSEDESRAYLGDLLWNPGERLGDVVVAAWAPVGKGRVIAVGDTTGMTNVSRILRWEWWSRVFQLGLMRDPADRWRELASAALLLAAGLAGWKLRPGHGLVALLAAALAAAWLAPRPLPVPLLSGSADVVWIDTSGRARGRLASWEPDGILALAASSLRSGLLPIYGDWPGEADLEAVTHVIVTPPQVDYPPQVAQRLLAWVADGGRLVLSCGREQAPRLAALLDPLDAWISSRILPGQGAAWVNRSLPGPMPFVPEAWWMGGSEAWRPRLVAGDAMVCGERVYGRGSVVLISDATFFTNYALEGRAGENLSNVAAFRTLLNEPLEEAFR